MINVNEKFADEYKSKLRTAQEAVSEIKSGQRVYIGTCSSMAYKLCEALEERCDELENVTLICSQNFRPSSFFDERGIGHFKTNSYFMGAQERKARQLGIGDYTSFHLSQIDYWSRTAGKSDAAFFEVSLPDENGYMSFGASGVALHKYIKENTSFIICQINKNQPYVYGEDNLIHISEADRIVEADDELPTSEDMPFSPEVQTISNMILEQIPDGATIQLGLGGLASAVGYGLKDKNDLGIHSELITSSMMHLMKEGVITNKKKTLMPGKAVASFAFGTNELYEFIDHNPDVYFMPFTKVNNPYTIAQNDNMISVNTAMSIDLFGQVTAESMGYHQHSAIGGQVDFVRGAQMSKGGKSFIAVTSTVNSKKQGRLSRIVSAFPPGTAVTTPRSDVQYVVTEYGCVNLKALTMRERVHAMISLAHPEFRQQLTDEAKAVGIY